MTADLVEYVHTDTCPNRYEHTAQECVLGRSLLGPAFAQAVDHLKVAPRDAAGARGILHDGACLSGCQGEGRADHARRTQARTVAAMRRWLAKPVQTNG